MRLRGSLLILWLAALASMGATYRTANFIAEGPTPQIAQQIGQAAEHYRKEKALLWLGQEMPAWPEPCPLTAKVTMSGAGGATSFAFDRGRVLGQNMNIEGSLDRLLSSVLPHEVTHTVFAYHFRCPVPRWADEGGAVLSEDDAERNRHDMLCRQILNTPGRAIPLRRLFALKDYPSDVMALYAQGFSVANFLVSNSSRPAFLNFVAQGMQQGWDTACQTHYHYRTVEELEQAWLTHLRSTKRQPAQLAANTSTSATPAGDAMQHVVVRQTAPPAQPILTGAPIYRGQASSNEHEAERFAPASVGRPIQVPAGNTPDPAIPAVPVSQGGWQPVPPPMQQPPPVTLLPPQFEPR